MRSRKKTVAQIKSVLGTPEQREKLTPSDEALLVKTLEAQERSGNTSLSQRQRNQIWKVIEKLGTNDQIL